ncbi:MAG: DUF255 domain-containing protein, partial [bacterium]|nr:DUF255 domain-containing protein [bacterium]
MNENKPPIVPTTEPESLPSKGKSGRFWQWFWLTFLVVSLAYAWYSFYVPSNRATWTVNYTTAQEQAVESDKPIILFFTGKWCSPCRIMKREVWADEQVMATVNDAFIPVMIDVDDPNAAATLNHFRVGVTPTTIITDSKGNVLQYRQGRISRT